MFGDTRVHYASLLYTAQGQAAQVPACVIYSSLINTIIVSVRARTCCRGATMPEGDGRLRQRMMEEEIDAASTARHAAEVA